MYCDALLTLSGAITGNTVTGQNVFASGASVTSTNAVDLASGGSPTGQVRDIGEGSDFAFLRAQVVTAFAGGTSCEFQAVAADDAAISTNVTVIGTTGAIPIAQLVAGARFAAQINPRIASKGQRYIAMRAVNVGANTAGAVFADIGAEIQDGQKFFPVGFAVL